MEDTAPVAAVEEPAVPSEAAASADVLLLPPASHQSISALAEGQLEDGNGAEGQLEDGNGAITNIEALDLDLDMAAAGGADAMEGMLSTALAAGEVSGARSEPGCNNNYELMCVADAAQGGAEAAGGVRSASKQLPPQAAVIADTAIAGAAASGNEVQQAEQEDEGNEVEKMYVGDLAADSGVVGVAEAGGVLGGNTFVAGESSRSHVDGVDLSEGAAHGGHALSGGLGGLDSRGSWAAGEGEVPVEGLEVEQQEGWHERMDGGDADEKGVQVGSQPPAAAETRAEDLDEGAAEESGGLATADAAADLAMENEESTAALVLGLETGVEAELSALSVAGTTAGAAGQDRVAPLPAAAAGIDEASLPVPLFEGGLQEQKPEAGEGAAPSHSSLAALAGSGGGVEPVAAAPGMTYADACRRGASLATSSAAGAAAGAAAEPAPRADLQGEGSGEATCSGDIATAVGMGGDMESRMPASSGSDPLDPPSAGEGDTDAITAHAGAGEEGQLLAVVASAGDSRLGALETDGSRGIAAVPAGDASLPCAGAGDEVGQEVVEVASRQWEGEVVGQASGREGQDVYREEQEGKGAEHLERGGGQLGQEEAEQQEQPEGEELGRERDEQQQEQEAEGGEAVAEDMEELDLAEEREGGKELPGMISSSSKLEGEECIRGEHQHELVQEQEEDGAARVEGEVGPTTGLLQQEPESLTTSVEGVGSAELDHQQQGQQQQQYGEEDTEYGEQQHKQQSAHLSGDDDEDAAHASVGGNQQSNLVQEEQSASGLCGAAAEDPSEAELGIVSDHGSDDEDDELSCNELNLSGQQVIGSSSRDSSSCWRAGGPSVALQQQEQQQQQERQHHQQQQQQLVRELSTTSGSGREGASRRSSRIGGETGGGHIEQSGTAAGTPSVLSPSVSSSSRLGLDQVSSGTRPSSRPSSAPCRQSSSSRNGVSSSSTASGQNGAPVVAPGYAAVPPWVPSGLCPATQAQLQGIIGREAASWGDACGMGQQHVGSRGSSVNSAGGAGAMGAGDGAEELGGGDGSREKRCSRSSAGGGPLGLKPRPASAGSNSSTSSSSRQRGGVVGRAGSGVGGATRMPRPPTAPARTAGGASSRAELHQQHQQQHQLQPALHTVHEVSPRSVSKSPQLYSSRPHHAPGVLSASGGSSSMRRFASGYKSCPGARPQTAPAGGRVAARVGTGVGSAAGAVGGSGRISPAESPPPDWDGHLKPVIGWAVIDPRGGGSSSSRPGTSYSSSSNYSYQTGVGYGSVGQINYRPNSADSCSRSSNRPGTSGAAGDVIQRAGLSTYMVDIVQKVRQANCCCQQLGFCQRYSLQSVGSGREQLRVLVENVMGEGCGVGGSSSSEVAGCSATEAAAEAQKHQQEQQEEELEEEGGGDRFHRGECKTRSVGVVTGSTGAADRSAAAAGGGGNGGCSPRGLKQLMSLGMFLQRHEQLRDRAARVQQRQQQQHHFHEQEWRRQQQQQHEEERKEGADEEENWMQEEGDEVHASRNSGGTSMGDDGSHCSGNSCKAEVWSAEDDGASVVAHVQACCNNQKQQQQNGKAPPSLGQTLVDGDDGGGCLEEEGDSYQDEEGLVHVAGVSYGVPAWIAEQMPDPARCKRQS